MKRFLLLTSTAIALSASVAFAHAHLQTSAPAQGASAPATTKTVTLTFTEDVQTKMSTFKVYSVANAAAGDQLFKTALNTKGDQAARTDSGVQAEAKTSKVTVNLRQPLKPGVYVVMWKVMAADDGHVTDGHYSFTVK